MTRSLAIMCTLVWLALPGGALAKPKVALTPIDGDKTGAVGNAVAEALEEEMTMIAPKAVNRAVDKYGSDDLTEKQAKKVASALEADAVVAGKLEKDGEHKAVRFKVYVPGKKARRFTVRFNTVKGLRTEENQSQLRETFAAKIAGKRAAVARDEEPEAEEDADARPSKKVRAEADDEDPLATKATKNGTKAKAKPAKGDVDSPAEDEAEAPKGKKAKKLANTDEADDTEAEEEPVPKAKKAKQTASEDEEPLDDLVDEDAASEDDAPRKADKKVATAEEDDPAVEAAVRKVSPRTSNSPDAFRIDVGPSVAKRSLTFNQRANFPEQVKPFSTAPVPGARVELELFPLAFGGSKGALAGIGIAGEFDRTLSLKLASTSEPDVRSNATQQHWLVGLRYRFGLGPAALAVGVGYGKRSFIIDRSGLMNATSIDIPDTAYTAIEPGLSIRVPLGSTLAFTLDGRGMIVRDAGPIQEPESFGRAKVYGGVGRFGIDVGLGQRFVVRLLAEYVHVAFKFTGEGKQSSERDMMPGIDVGGALDRSLGGAVTFGMRM
ncbi:MAG: hypothetical protein AB7O24_23070 [Kofleriaceae bacterium]